MTSRHVSLAAILIAAAGVALVLAQRSSQTPAGMTVTGCVRQGSGPAVFILRGAAIPLASPAPVIARDAPPRFEDGHQPSESAVDAADYLLVSVPARVDLSAHLNHKMEITGEKSDSAAPPAGANAAERALPRLAVSDGHEVAPSCSSAPLAAPIR
jgi:hypothetical protein